MKIRLVALSFVCAVMATACTSSPQFWRPISEPNVLLPSTKLQSKLEFDLSQCHCGIFPSNITHDDALAFQRNKQRIAQTGLTEGEDDDEGCSQKPSLVVTECMRARGWEPTNCSGRMPLPNGGSFCAGYEPLEPEE